MSDLYKSDVARQVTPDEYKNVVIETTDDKHLPTLFRNLANFIEDMDAELGDQFFLESVQYHESFEGLHPVRYITVVCNLPG